MSNKPTPFIDKFCEQTGAEIRSEKQTAEDGTRCTFWWLAKDERKSPKFASLNALESRVRFSYEAMIQQFGVKP